MRRSDEAVRRNYLNERRRRRYLRLGMGKNETSEGFCAVGVGLILLVLCRFLIGVEVGGCRWLCGDICQVRTV